MISQDLAEALSRLSLLPVDWQGRAKLVSWLDTLSTMQASDELDESQARQLSFDLESAYNDFNKILHSSWEAQRRLVNCILSPEKTVSSYINSLPGPLVDYCSLTAVEIGAVNCQRFCKRYIGIAWNWNSCITFTPLVMSWSLVSNKVNTLRGSPQSLSYF